MSVAADLRNLRMRAGLSMREMAEAMGLKGPSSYQAYESESRHAGGKTYLPMEYRDAVAGALTGKGDPAISVEEVARLFAPGGSAMLSAVPTSSPIVISREAVAEAERYVALASPINAAPKDIVRHLFVGILGFALEAPDASHK